MQQRQHHKLLVVKGLRFAPVVLPLWRRGTPAEVSGDTNVASTASCELPYNGKPLATSALRVSAWKLRGSGRGLGRWWQKFFFAYKNLFGHGISKCKRFLLSRESNVGGVPSTSSELSARSQACDLQPYPHRPAIRYALQTGGVRICFNSIYPPQTFLAIHARPQRTCELP